MFLVHLALLPVVTCFDMEVEGDVAFDVRISNWHKGKQMWFRQGWAEGNQEKNELVFKMMQVRQNVTVAPEVECIYQYPEKEHINAMLSNMMNQLTKVFVRANDFITEGEVRRREADSRFKIVDKKRKEFFELIYANMTNEYRNFYNTTAQRVDRSGRDPCQHQDEIKQIWRDLLEHSLTTLKTAGQHCVEEYLRDEKIGKNSKIRVRLGQFLSRELGKVRSSQLDMLCDTFQLCYNELLK